MIDPQTGLDNSVKTHNPTLKEVGSLSYMGGGNSVSSGQADGSLSYMNQYKEPLEPILGVDESKYNINLSPSEIMEKGIESVRAKNQPFHHEAANALVQMIGGEALGGTLEGFGYLAELLKGNAIAVDSENMLIDLGRNIKETLAETNKIYQSDPNAFMLTNHEAFFSNVISLGSTLSMMIPAMGTAKVLGSLGKLVGNAARATSIGRKILPRLSSGLQESINGLLTATISRQIENNLEAYGTYEEAKAELKGQINPETGKLFTDEEIEKGAMEAAESTYYKNWVMLAQDIPQYLAVGKIFNTITKKYVDKVARKPGKFANAKLILSQAGWEGAEEAYQYVSAEESMYNLKLSKGMVDESTFDSRMRNYLDETEMWNAVTAGAFGGAFFQVAGKKINNLINDPSRKVREQREASLAALRGTMFAELNETMSKADAEGDAVASLEARKLWNTHRTIEALEADKFEDHIEFLEDLKNASPEELEEFKQTYNAPELTKEFIDAVVPELIKDADALRSKYFKFRGKYGEAAPHIAIAEATRDKYIKIRDSVQQKIADLKGSHPLYGELTSHGKALFDLQAEALALKNEVALHKLSYHINGDKEAFDKATKDIKEEVEKSKAKAKELKESDERTAEEKLADKEIITNMENNSELFEAMAQERHAKRNIIKYENDAAHYRSEDFLKEIADSKIANLIKAAKTKEQVEAIENSLDEESLKKFQETIDNKKKTFTSDETKSKVEKKVQEDDNEDEERASGKSKVRRKRKRPTVKKPKTKPKAKTKSGEEDDTLDVDDLLITRDKKKIQEAASEEEEVDYEISDEEYQEYIDTGKISREALELIADKIAEGETLSQNELAIYDGNARAIEEILRAWGDEDTAPAPTNSDFVSEDDENESNYQTDDDVKKRDKETSDLIDSGEIVIEGGKEVEEDQISNLFGPEQTGVEIVSESQDKAIEDLSEGQNKAVESNVPKTKKTAVEKNAAEKKTTRLKPVALINNNSEDEIFDEVSAYYDWIIENTDKRDTPVQLVQGEDYLYLSEDKRNDRVELIEKLLDEYRAGQIADEDLDFLIKNIEIKAVMLDSNGNPIEIDGKQVWNYVFGITKNSKPNQSASLYAFREEFVRRVANGEETKTSVYGSNHLKFNNIKGAENSLEEVFKNFDPKNIVLVDGDGKYRAWHQKEADGSYSLSEGIEHRSAPGKQGIFHYKHEDNRGGYQLPQLGRKTVDGEYGKMLYRIYAGILNEEYKYTDEIPPSLEMDIEELVPTIHDIIQGDITIAKLLNFITWQGKKSNGNGRLKIWGRKVYYGKDSMTEDEFLSEEGREVFLEWLRSQKSRNIQAAKFGNEAYMRYLLDEGVLYTDLDKDQPYSVKDDEGHFDGQVWLNQIYQPKPKPTLKKKKTKKAKPKKFERRKPTAPVTKTNKTPKNKVETTQTSDDSGLLDVDDLNIGKQFESKLKVVRDEATKPKKTTKKTTKKTSDESDSLDLDVDDLMIGREDDAKNVTMDDFGVSKEEVLKNTKSKKKDVKITYDIEGVEEVKPEGTAKEALDKLRGMLAGKTQKKKPDTKKTEDGKKEKDNNKKDCNNNPF